MRVHTASTTGILTANKETGDSVSLQRSTIPKLLPFSVTHAHAYGWGQMTLDRYYMALTELRKKENNAPLRSHLAGVPHQIFG